MINKYGYVKGAADLYIPKHREIIVDLSRANGPSPMGRMGGRFKVRRGKEVDCLFDSAGAPIPGTGRDVVLEESGWSSNLITNTGMDRHADNDWGTNCAKCHVGTGNTAPTNGDSTLDVYLTGTTISVDTVSSATASAPYYAKNVRTWRFGAGVAEGILAEVGASFQEATGGLFSRALILTGGGTPTTIQVLSDEWLDVVYEWRMYPDFITHATGAPDDATGTVDVGGVSYDYAARPCLLTDGGSGGWYWIVPQAKGKLFPIVLSGGFAYSSDATIGAVTSTPSATDEENLGTTSGLTISHDTYVNGTHTREATWTIGLTEGNVTDGGGDGWGGAYTRGGLGIYQYTFDKTTGGGPIPKDDTKIMTMVWTLAWSRYTIP